MLARMGLNNPAVRRGFILLALMQFAFGFALNAQQNIVTNYFEPRRDILVTERVPRGFLPRTPLLLSRRVGVVHDFSQRFGGLRMFHSLQRTQE